MKYRELVKQVQHYSGFSLSESEEALRLFITILSARLGPDERKDFTSQLPQELKDETMETAEVIRYNSEDLYEVLADVQGIEEDHAKKQVMAVWSALKDHLTKGQVQDIKSQLPEDLNSELQSK